MVVGIGTMLSALAGSSVALTLPSLGRELGGRFGLELRAIILGGAHILEKLHHQRDPFGRPRLDSMDRLKIAWGAIRQGFK